MKIRPVVKGLLTFIPGSENILPVKKTGGTDTAYYCYSVWIKHLTMLWENGVHSMPNTLAELGPGDSIGIGLAAMLSGVNKYFALDVVEYSNTDFNLKIFDELVSLFKNRASRVHKGWPEIVGYLDENRFPSHILTDERLSVSLADERITQLRSLIENPGRESKELTIKYMVPWSESNVIEKESVDLIMSHSVLEHVVDLEAAYHAFYSWLKPGGIMSHQIDFTSHGLSEKWNGYRAYSEFLWKIIVGKRKYLINRQPVSVHLNLMDKYDFDVFCLMKNNKPNGIEREELSSYWKDISNDDLACSGAFIQAKK